jgi:hypothetical protein
MLLILFNFYHVRMLLMFYNSKILSMNKGDQQRITRHKRVPLIFIWTRLTPALIFKSTGLVVDLNSYRV